MDAFLVHHDRTQRNTHTHTHTRYFSSFPNLKRSLRVLESTLRHAELLALLAAATVRDEGAVATWEAALGWGRHTVAILQHHDAVTGTGGDACNAEYAHLFYLFLVTMSKCSTTIVSCKHVNTLIFLEIYQE